MSSSIYTRTGDKGRTSLVGAARVPKDSIRVEAYGTIDEANSWVGVARACTTHPVLWDALDFLQHRLFNCSSNLATPADAAVVPPTVDDADVEFLERSIDHYEDRSGPLSGFILPGGNQCAAYIHVARTVLRRAERRIVTLAADEPVDPMVMKFVNRSSDFLFAAARYSNYTRGRTETCWDKEHPRPELPEKLQPSERAESGCDPCSKR
jgi:cob(I)alamin adenosyltransferase